MDQKMSSGQISNFEIKQELDDTEFDVEDLHHSIDIKEESHFLEPEQIKCECYLCGIQFCDKSQLIKHLDTQCLEKPFSCEICAFRCLTKLQLNRHTKTHIEGQIEESKEKENRRNAKKTLETEISIGKTRAWIDKNTFEDFDYDVTQKILKKDDNFFDTSTDQIYDDLSSLQSNANTSPRRNKIKQLHMNISDSENKTFIDESIDDSGNNDFNINTSETSSTSSANKSSKSTSNETVIKPLSKKTTNTRYKETKLMRCKFCADDITTKNFMRHLERQHKAEEKVRDILKYPRNSKERRRAFGLYRNEINFDLYINGLTRPNRLSSKDSVKNATYYPCGYCRGLYLKNYLKRHVKTCFVQKEPLNRTEGRRKFYLSHSQTVTACAMDPTDVVSKMNVIENVFNYMKVDEIAFEAKKDLFIAHFGESYLRNHKVSRLTYTTCSNRLREFSRLLINYRKIVNDSDISFKDLLHSKNFDSVIIAAREVVGYDQVKNTLKAPTLAVHLGISLRSACDELTHLVLKRSKGYQSSSLNDLNTWLDGIKNFKKLVETRWSTALTSCAYKEPTVSGVQQVRDGSMPVDTEKSLYGINLNPNVVYIKEDKNEDSDESYNTEVFQKNRKFGRKRRWNSAISISRESVQDIDGEVTEATSLLLPQSISNCHESIYTADILGSPAVPKNDQLNLQHAEVSNLIKTKRIRKPDFCFFCEMDVFNFARHIRRTHISELEVTKIFALEINSKERKDLIATLRKRGNFKRKFEIYRKPVRSSKLDRLAEKCVPCKHCLGFYSSRQLWRHIRKCKLNKGNSTTAFSHLTDAQNLLLEGIEVDQELADTVFPRMLADKISLVAKKDALICMFGAHYIKRHREKHYIHVCSRKMRELSRLLIAMMDADPSITSMYEVLQPQNFDFIVQSTKEVAKLDSTKENCKLSTYATNINISLKKCCDLALLNVVKGESIESNNLAEESKAGFKQMKHLLQVSWCFEASQKTASMRWNKISIITLVSDLKIFKAYLEMKSSKAYSEFERNNKNSKAFQTLMETVFCSLVLLNRERIRELQCIPLKVYVESDSVQIDAEDSADVTLTERILLRNFKRVVIRNTNGKRVLILFSTELQHHMQKLIELRKHFISSNIFLFASLKKNISIVSRKVLYKYASGCGAEDPMALIYNRLRKCLATISQLLSMSGENGEAAQYQGKELDELDIDLKIDVDDLNCSDSDPGSSRASVQLNTTKKQRRILVPWTEHQKRKTIKFFASHIKNKQPPKRFEVEELKLKTGNVFDNKSWQQVKVFVQNQYTKK